MDFLQAQISQRSTNVDRLSQLINQGKNFDYENWKEGADKTFQEQLTKFSDLGQRAVSEKIAREGEAVGAFTGAPAAYKLGTGFYKYGLGESGKGFFDRGATKAIGYRDVAIDKVKAKFASDKAPVEEPAVAQEAETTGLEDALLGFGGETTAASQAASTAATTTEGARFAIFPGQVQPEVAEAEAAQIQASQATEATTTAATEGATTAATEGAADVVVSDVVGDGAAAAAATGIGAPIVGAIAAAGALTFGLVELFGHHSHHPHRPTLPSFSAGAIASQYNLGSTILPNIANQAKEIGTSVF